MSSFAKIPMFCVITLIVFPLSSLPGHSQAAVDPPIAIQKVTAGDTEITVSNAVADTDYDFYKWTPGAAGAACPAVGTPEPGAGTKMGVAMASSSRSIDFNISAPALAPIAGDCILLARVGGAVLASTTAAASTPTDTPRVIVGYEQSGANSANSAGRLFVDTYYGHLISKSRARMFGEARIGSGAQNSSSTIGTFVTGLSGTANNLKLNQVASVAEFLTGMEFSITKPSGANTSRLAVFGEYGASGNLQAAELNNIYAFPAQGTQAYSLLVAAEMKQPSYNPNLNITSTCLLSTTPAPKIIGVANNCMFVELSQQQPYFDQEGYAGIKSVSVFTGGGSSAPDVISVGFGANHAVNRNMNFNAMRIEGFMPFSLPKSKGSTQSSIPMI